MQAQAAERPTSTKRNLPPELWAAIDQKRKEMKAAEVQRRKQQGLGRPIVSHEHNGFRFVAVGMKLLWEKADRWKTFHVFLNDYLHRLFGVDWVRTEKAKPEQERHPIVRWLIQSEADLAKNAVKQGDIRSGPMTGAIRAYLNLAYNLYLIGHHARCDADRILQSYVDRLKSARSDDFTGALFETYAAAALLKAGFKLDFEDEKDGSISHVEFVATYLPTGKKFSVEVKARDWQPNANRRLRVARKLSQALAKHAEHERLVFIEVNGPRGHSRRGD
jgi:hypothetical protein